MEKGRPWVSLTLTVNAWEPMAGEGNLATCGLSERESHHTGNWNRAWDANNLTASLMDALGFWLIYNSKLD